MQLPKYATLDWSEKDEPLSPIFGDIYFSPKDGVAETHYVFIEQNRLIERFKKITPSNPIFKIGEIGFGSGLNFFCTVDTFLKHAPVYAHLHFISTELYPLTSDDFAKAAQRWPQFFSLSRDILKQYPPLTPGFHSLSCANGRVRLLLLLGDATEQLLQVTGAKIDAWFLDGFAPSKNPQLWTTDLFKVIAKLSNTSTTLATFTAASHINKHLTAHGFQIEKIAGFAGKREMLRGHFIGTTYPHYNKRWLEGAYHQPRQREAIIIGSGLAGATIAHELAQCDWRITVLEKNTLIANESSGNLQGALYPRLSAFHNTPNELTLTGFIDSARFYERHFCNQSTSIWTSCGLLQLPHNDKEKKRQQELKSSFYPPDIVSVVDPKTASTLAGIPINESCLYFPRSGWANPSEICAHLLNHTNIKIRTHCSVERIQHRNDVGWYIYDVDEQLIAHSETLIIATGITANHFDPTQYLPLKKIRGQVSYVPAQNQLQQLNTIISAENYIMPAHPDGLHCVGATFDLHNDTPEMRSEDHLSNLATLKNHFPPLYESLVNVIDIANLGGRVNFRTTTADYMPIVGPVPIASHFVEAFPQLRVDANATLKKNGIYYPGLFVNTAHSSRGLLTCPISAKLLAAYINNDILPVSQNLAEAMHPARFIIKDLTRRAI